MEEKIYDRQVTKQSLSFRVVDQQQIERHFTTTELAELYTFEPELLDDTSGKKRKTATPLLPKVKRKKKNKEKLKVLPVTQVLNNYLVFCKALIILA